MKRNGSARVAVFLLALLAFLALTQASCQSSLPRRMSTQEDDVGTTGEDDWLYHRIVDEPYALGLHSPGYLVALEKTSRGDIGLAPEIEAHADFPLRPRFDQHGNELEPVFDDPKRAFLSHVVRYAIEPGRGVGTLAPSFVYNAYEDDNRGSAERNYLRGLEALEALESALAADLEEQRITHLFLYAMGWNADQQEALRNYNSLYGNILQIAADSKAADFRPLMIGLTWDSSWQSRFIPSQVSYPRTARDADEVGAVWVNLLLRNVLVPLKQERAAQGRPLRLVLVGHSFGSRALTRALFSSPVLAATADAPIEPSQVDLVIGLESAFSANRFIPGAGREGSPFRDFRSVAAKFAYTWSRHDSANRFAVWVSGAKHLGGGPGYRETRRHTEIFEHVQLADDGGWLGARPTCDGSEIAVVDASRVVRHAAFRKGGGAHSDIYSPQVARFVWNLLTSCAPVQTLAVDLQPLAETPPMP